MCYDGEQCKQYLFTDYQNDDYYLLSRRKISGSIFLVNLECFILQSNLVLYCDTVLVNLTPCKEVYEINDC